MNAALRILLGVATILFGLGAFVWYRFGPAGDHQANDRTTEPPKPELSQRFALKELGSRLGLTFRHDPGRPTFFYPEIMGAGVAVADFNRDGRLDVLLRGRRPGIGHPHHVPGPTTALYLQKADGTFEDASDRSGITDDGYAMGVAVGDLNNDGIPDVYLCNFGQDKLYVGKGDGTFIDVTESAGVANHSFASSACFVDIDRDGRLDLYVANYVAYPHYIECVNKDLEPGYCEPRKFKGLPHKLYRNVTPPGSRAEQVRFEDVSVKSGVAKRGARGLGVILCDANDDGWPDLYVANDLEANFLWINEKNGTFTESAAAQGVAVNRSGQPQASMGVIEADLDGDGKLDLAVANFRDEYTTVYCRRAYGFQDRSSALGVTLLTRPYTGFGLAALDLDCDGVDEIIQANGRVTQIDSPTGISPLPTGAATAAKLRVFWDAYAERSLMLCRVGDQYVDVGEEAGDFGRWVGVGRGLAIGDVDGDGRPDLVAVDLADRAKLFFNRAEKRGRWISVRAIDPSKGGRDMLGALVTVVLPERRVSRRVRTCGSYQSASEPRAFFGLGNVSTVERIEVVWPDGELAPETFAAPKLDHAYTLMRSQGTVKR